MKRPSVTERLAATNQRIAVTGATGWFGRVTLDLLGQTMGPESFHSQVSAYARRPHDVEVEGAGKIKVRALSEIESTDWLFHYAFMTQDKINEIGIETYVSENLGILRIVLDLVERCSLSGLFYTSSGSARCPNFDDNPYGALKRLDEIALNTSCKKAGTPCVIARVFNVSGAHMTKPEKYALGDLILRVKEGRTLEISASKRVVRSFVAVRDVIMLAIALLFDRESAVFETAGEQEVEIEELADIVRNTLGCPKLPIVRDISPGISEDRYVGKPGEFAALAERYDLVPIPLDAQIRETAKALL